LSVVTVAASVLCMCGVKKSMILMVMVVAVVVAVKTMPKSSIFQFFLALFSRLDNLFNVL